MKFCVCSNCGTVVSIETIYNKTGGVAILNETAHVVKCPVCAELIYENKDAVQEEE